MSSRCYRVLKKFPSSNFLVPLLWLYFKKAIKRTQACRKHPLGDEKELLRNRVRSAIWCSKHWLSEWKQWWEVWKPVEDMRSVWNASPKLIKRKSCIFSAFPSVILRNGNHRLITDSLRPTKRVAAAINSKFNSNLALFRFHSISREILRAQASKS